MVLESETEVYEGLILQMNQAVGLFTPEYQTCLSLWNGWNAHGVLPYSGGKWEQPAHVNEILDLMDSVYARWSNPD